MTLLNHTDSDPIFHEAPVWYVAPYRLLVLARTGNMLMGSPRYPAKDEMFFVQNAGAKAAGTGLSKSAIIQKISLSAVTPFMASQKNASGSVRVEVIDSNPTVMNPNGGLLVWYVVTGTGLIATENQGRQITRVNFCSLVRDRERALRQPCISSTQNLRTMPRVRRGCCPVEPTLAY